MQHASQRPMPLDTRPVSLQARGLSKFYGALCVLDQLSLEVLEGERVVILGPNGAGKSTLIQLLAGELQPSAGEVLFMGQSVTRLSSRQRAVMGMRRTFQHSQCMAGLRVQEHLMLALRAASGEVWSLQRLHDPQLQSQVLALAESTGVTDLLPQFAADLSHGEKRQLELAMAMAGQARVLLLDEPAAGLSVRERQWLAHRLQSLPREQTLLLIEHDMEVALAVAERVIVLQNGRLIFSGSVEETVSSPLVQSVYLGHSGQETSHA